MLGEGCISLEARSGAKWTWLDHDMLRDETSLETLVIWGKWQDKSLEWLDASLLDRLRRAARFGGGWGSP